MEPIRWEDPPPSPFGGPKGIWLQRLQPLIEQPKRWALLRVTATPGQARTTAHDLNHYRYRIPAGRWEFTSSTVDGRYCVYGRYLGPDDEDGES